MRTVTFIKGQPVYWPHAVDGIAQIDELLRRRVRIVYRSRSGGRLRYRTLPAERLARIDASAPTLFALPFNPLDRGILSSARPKTYCISLHHERSCA